MSTPYLTEIRIFSFDFAPKGWAMCNGQLLSISQNQAIFALIGTTYGGNGTSNFGLPNLQGRIALHNGSNFTIGQTAGEAAHTLLVNEMPGHTHIANADATAANAAQTRPNNNVPGNAAPTPLYSAGASLQSMSSAMIANFGGGAAHENRQPFLTLNFCIALQGVFPTRS